MMANANIPCNRSTQRVPILHIVDDHFGIGVSAELVARGMEPAAKLAEIVNLAVKNDG